MHISVVSPVYMAETILTELVNQLHVSLKKLTNDYEIILVEDGSPDQSWDVIEKICINDAKVVGIKLSRNFGQHYAITAGLDNAKGEWVVVMDCDLQDRPDEIEHLYNKAKEGYDLVFAQRTLRQDTFMKKLYSKIFYKLFSYLTDTDQDASIANFGIYSKQVIESVLSMKDYIRFFPTMVQWVGYKRTKVSVKHSSRLDGISSYSFSKLIKLAFNNIISFSDKPLRILMKMGCYISLMSFFIGIYYLYQYFSGQITVLGFSSIIITITFLSGIIILTLGSVGIYVGKTFESSKRRPLYLVNKKING